MAGEEQETAAEATLDAIPLVVVAEEAEAPAQGHRGFTIPRIVDYVIVAIFMYFTL